MRPAAPKNQGQRQLRELVVGGFNRVCRETDIPANILTTIVADGKPEFLLRKRLERVGISLRSWEQTI